MIDDLQAGPRLSGPLEGGKGRPFGSPPASLVG
jgi:hypothetical protein